VWLGGGGVYQEWWGGAWGHRKCGLADAEVGKYISPHFFAFLRMQERRKAHIDMPKVIAFALFLKRPEEEIRVFTAYDMNGYADFF
jgi:hypothetical protein